MATLCQKCGVTGYPELLIYCRKCRTSAEHRYCLNILPKKNEEVHWLCDLCKPKCPKMVSLEKLISDSGRNKDNPEYRDRQTSYSYGTPRPKDQYQQIPSPATTVSIQKSQSGDTSDSRHEVNEGENNAHSSWEQGKAKRRRRLILAADDQLYEELQSVCVDQNVPNRATEIPNEPLVALPPPENALILPIASSSHTNAHDEVMNSSQILSGETTVSQAMVQVEMQALTNQPLYLAAQPIIYHVWRGCFYVGNEEYGPLKAHLSSKACEKVSNVAKLLPPVLYMEKLSAFDAWPNSFKTAPPTDDNIALYFLPEFARVEAVLDQLLDDVINNDLVLKFIFDEVELLVFSSIILPKDHHRFQGKYYPWGAFRGRQAPVPALPANCPSKTSELTEENPRMVVSNKHAGEKEEVEGHDEESSDVTQNSSNAPFPQCSTLQPSKLNEVTEDIQRMEDSSKHAGEKEGMETHDEQSSDVAQNGNIVILPQSSGLFSSVSRELTKEIQRMKGVEANKPHCSELFWRKQVLVPSVFTEEKRRMEEDPDCTGEREEGEICDEYFDISEKGDDEAHCLKLFPLQVEDMAIAARVGRGNELDLKLGLRHQSVGNEEGRSKAPSKFFSQSFV